ncbi:MAG: HNH endonuclease signature motif containing protein [Hyphomicrobium sp.]|jgi:5-methylcytosine-specific restriction endonuclease McrA
MGRLSNIRSGLKPMSGRLRLPPKIADSLYTSREWRELVARIKRARGAWCVICGSKHRLIGDHIIEIRDGGAPLDTSNVELLCFTCHQRKTAAARLKRARGQT